jgi:predicted SAM-dependent methyltransferase
VRGPFGSPGARAEVTVFGLDRLKGAVPERYKKPLAEARLSLSIASGKLAKTLFPPPLPDAPELYLHLGCGGINHPRFVNVDGYPYPHVHSVRPIDDLAPFADDTAALVYACHCLEHFPMAEIPRILAEWRRVLRPGGVLRLSVPDFDRVLAIYAEHDRDLAAISRVLLGGQDGRFNFHHALFTTRSLTQLFEAAGFREVRAWTPGSSELTTFDDWSAREVPIDGQMHAISLNLEAVK